MHVLGTAGHVDHGKSTLIKALTGIQPDRLKEELAREMTIDLGFAWLTLPGGEEVGIIDVPGHRDFIENMLAGVGGIDATLFVVAADEGVMPQTREHLAILDLLQVKGGVVALTKMDLALDPGWIELVESDLHKALQGTILENAPVIPVSARAGTGLEELKLALASLLQEQSEHVDLGRPRLNIDRVFSIAGFGTVVTGTLMDGCLAQGNEVEILPSGLRSRIRGLQTHKKKEDSAKPGSRTAVNLSGLDVRQVARGNVLSTPGKYSPSRRLDVSFRMLADAQTTLQHNSRVKLFIGAAEVLCRVRVLGKEELKPGQSGWLQLELEQSVVSVRGDRFIVRNPSPGETLGGGMVVDPQPAGRHKRFSNQVLSKFASLARGTPEEILYHAFIARGISTLAEICERAGMPLELAEKAVRALLAEGKLVSLDEEQPTRTPSELLFTSRENYHGLTQQVIKEVSLFHKNHPLKRSMGREELKNRLNLPPRFFQAIIQKWVRDYRLVEEGGGIRLPDYSVKFNIIQQQKVDRLLLLFSTSPMTPPSIKECINEVGEEIYQVLLDQGKMVQLSGDVVFNRGAFDMIHSRVLEILMEKGSITVSQFRDLFKTSRKYSLAFLEFMDQRNETHRDGDFHRIGSG